MYNGEFYDASAYKADPVPMALDAGTVYEAERSGVSEGLFTVAGALTGNGTFIGTGKWEDAAAVAEAAAAAKKREAQKTPSEPRGMDQDSGPPRLMYPTADKTAPATPAPPKAEPPATPPPPAKTAPPTPAAAPNSAPAMPGEASDENDPNRPRLRREPAPAQVEKHEDAEPTVKAAVSAETPTSATASHIQLIPAISDAGGPNPQSYVYTITADQQKQFPEAMLKMANAAVQAYVQKWTAGPEPLPAVDAPRRRMASCKTAARLPQPKFENPQLRVFDPSASNAPVLVMSATAELPASPAIAKSRVGPQLFVTLIARQDIYGDLHQIKANITDLQHLDVAPRMQLIDVVDADGDGRGELLFRETSDQGSGFAIYRIIGDSLYNLFQSTPGE